MKISNGVPQRANIEEIPKVLELKDDTPIASVIKFGNLNPDEDGDYCLREFCKALSDLKKLVTPETPEMDLEHMSKWSVASWKRFLRKTRLVEPTT